jgi:Smg protein
MKMKQQSIVDIIVYLLEEVVSRQSDISEPKIVKQRLEEAGFAKETIGHAFDWLKELIEQQCWYAASSQVNPNKTLRIFGSEEICKISLETRSFILSLEYAGVLDTKMREIIISQLMQLNQCLVDLVDAKWVVLLVLMSKSNKNLYEMRNYLLTTMAQEE